MHWLVGTKCLTGEVEVYVGKPLKRHLVYLRGDEGRFSWQKRTNLKMKFTTFVACVFGLKECMDRGDPGDVWGPPLMALPPVPPAPTDPTPTPTIDPTFVPTIEPTIEPTFRPTTVPTCDPTRQPTVEPSFVPTRQPTPDPTFEPSRQPTRAPTFKPTRQPTRAPTRQPVIPVRAPTARPTREPTFEPTRPPTRKPTFEPTRQPTRDPTFQPTRQPNREPTFRPTREPTCRPTRRPTAQPTRRAPTPQPTPTPRPGQTLARFTRYQSYPMCCPDSPNYDPAAPTIECSDYSGCVYMGLLPAMYTPTNVRGKVDLEFLQTHNNIAFYDDSDYGSKNWRSQYSGRIIQLTKEYAGKTYIFNASILNTCGNSNCGGCCARNAGEYGYLVDMEWYTVLNNFGTLDAAKGSIHFIIF